jgi:hypothetical protein
LVSELVNDSVPAKDLTSERCSLKLDEVFNDPVSILKNSVFSSRLDVMVNDPVSPRRSERCSTRVEERPSEPDTLLAKPFTSVPVTENDPARDLARPLV